jgi:hypothetical protein
MSDVLTKVFRVLQKYGKLWLSTGMLQVPVTPTMQ